MSTRIFTLTTARRPAALDENVTVSLGELLPDEGGEVVVCNQTGVDVTVLTDDPVTERGVALDHVTRAGLDVSGFVYCRFSGGITVFYPRTQSLCVLESDSDAS